MKTEIQTHVDKSFRIQPTLSGYYVEFLVCNMTRNTIVIIDEQNHRAYIQPCREVPARNCVQIEYRYCNGTREKRTRNSATEVAIDSTKITIPGWLIETGSQYIKQLNILIANVAIGATMMHPSSNGPYTEALVEAVEKICDPETSTSLRFLVNDPQARYTEIYGALGSSIFEISCTHIIDDGENQEEATLNIIAGTNKRTYVQARVCIEELFDKGTLSLDSAEVPIALGLTPSEAEAAGQIQARRAEQRIFECVNVRMSNERKAFEVQLANAQSKLEETVEEHKAVLGRAKSKLDTSETTCSNLKAELAAAKQAGMEWHALYDAHIQEKKVLEECKAEEAKRMEAEEKARRAATATSYSNDTEAMKFIHMACKLFGGALVAVAVPYVTSKLKL